MRSTEKILVLLALIVCLGSCHQKESSTQITTREILGNPDYLAISYGGYRQNTREIQPTIDEVKQDMRILHAMGIRILRTYNVQLPHATTVLKAIRSLKEENPEFEMYVMLGAWINCLNAWTELTPDHNQESPDNKDEISRAVKLANEYSDIVKIIGVGNEAMVKWAAAYYVQPEVILKWVNHLQNLKKEGKLPKDTWITSSDNFASWGGGGPEYHVQALNDLIKAVDYLSVHTYPMHDTHYNPDFWGITREESRQSRKVQVNLAMERALDYATIQYAKVKAYVESLGVSKPVHIGETGWASFSNELYGNNGSKATDEYKQGLYYRLIREWTNKNRISCFYFEAFDEQWKDAGNPGGSENHLGLFTIDDKAKFAIWDQVDAHVFDGLSRDGNKIVKTWNGNEEKLLDSVHVPEIKERLILPQLTNKPDA